MGFERRQTSKIYEAVIDGHLNARTGCINLPIKVDWPNRPLQMISHSEGRYALTRWKRTGFEGDRTRVELFPNTGRSHSFVFICNRLAIQLSATLFIILIMTPM